MPSERLSSCPLPIHPELFPIAQIIERMTTIAQLPNEILSMILRIATLDAISLQPSFSDPFELATYISTEKERLIEIMSVKLAISTVCRRWNAVSAPFLYEYVPCLEVKRLQTLAACLEKEQDGGMNQGKWTRRIDIDLGFFEKDQWDYYYNSNHSSAVDSWDQILPLTPGVTVIGVSSTDDSAEYFEGFTRGFFESIGRLEHLQRVEWSAAHTNLWHLHGISMECPQLRHIAIKLCGNPGHNHPHPSTNRTLSFPFLESLILDYTSSPSVNLQHQHGMGKSWHLPNLTHFGFYMKNASKWDEFISKILGGVKVHIKSLDLLENGSSLPVLSMNFLSSFSVLETLFINPCTTRMDEEIPETTITPFPSLQTVGWRFTNDSYYGHKGQRTRELKSILTYFNQRRRFPNLSTILFPEDFEGVSVSRTSK